MTQQTYKYPSNETIFKRLNASKYDQKTLNHNILKYYNSNHLMIIEITKNQLTIKLSSCQRIIYYGDLNAQQVLSILLYQYTIPNKISPNPFINLRYIYIEQNSLHKISYDSICGIINDQEIIYVSEQPLKCGKLPKFTIQYNSRKSYNIRQTERSNVKLDIVEVHMIEENKIHNRFKNNYLEMQTLMPILAKRSSLQINITDKIMHTEHQKMLQYMINQIHKTK